MGHYPQLRQTTLHQRSTPEGSLRCGSLVPSTARREKRQSDKRIGESTKTAHICTKSWDHSHNGCPPHIPDGHPQRTSISLANSHDGRQNMSQGPYVPVNAPKRSSVTSHNQKKCKLQSQKTPRAHTRPPLLVSPRSQQNREDPLIRS